MLTVTLKFFEFVNSLEDKYLEDDGVKLGCSFGFNSNCEEILTFVRKNFKFFDQQRGIHIIPENWINLIYKDL
jgi:hypothetical protein